MNAVLKTIYSRRSIRSFKPDQIRKEDLDAIIEAGLSAPSANNSQNWHFTVIQKREMIEKVNGWMVSEVKNSKNAMLQGVVERVGGRLFYDAPTVIVVSSDKNDRFGETNASIASENMLLAAESLGVGSCWTGMVVALSLGSNLLLYSEVLGIPDGYVPHIGILLGYRASETPVARPRKENLVTYIL